MRGNKAWCDWVWDFFCAPAVAHDFSQWVLEKEATQFAENVPPLDGICVDDTCEQPLWGVALGFHALRRVLDAQSEQPAAFAFQSDEEVPQALLLLHQVRQCRVHSTVHAG